MPDYTLDTLTADERNLIEQLCDMKNKTADEIIALALEKAARGADRRRKKRAQIIRMRLDRAAKP